MIAVLRRHRLHVPHGYPQPGTAATLGFHAMAINWKFRGMLNHARVLPRGYSSAGAYFIVSVPDVVNIPI